jgi:hypothetical protein
MGYRGPCSLHGCWFLKGRFHREETRPEGALHRKRAPEGGLDSTDQGANRQDAKRPVFERTGQAKERNEAGQCRLKDTAAERQQPWVAEACGRAVELRSRPQAGRWLAPASRRDTGAVRQANARWRDAWHYRQCKPKDRLRERPDEALRDLPEWGKGVQRQTVGGLHSVQGFECGECCCSLSLSSVTVVHP